MSQVAQGSDNHVEMSQNLRVTLQRAGTYVSEQSHRFVTIEHVLLALNEDPEAELMLQACEIDQGRLHSDVSNYLGRLEDRLTPGEAAQPVFDTEAARIVNSAVIAAQKSRRSEVNGAIVLAAIIGDAQTPAAQMLLAQGLNFKAAIDALQTAKAPAPTSAPLPHMQDGQSGSPEAANPSPIAANDDTRRPSPSAAEDALAQARERIRATQEAARHNLPLKPSRLQPAENSPEDHNGAASQTTSDAHQSETEAKPPQPLQTEDSLARFERRSPPNVHASPEQPQRAPAPPENRTLPPENFDANEQAQPVREQQPPEPVLDPLEDITEPPAPPPNNPPPFPAPPPQQQIGATGTSLPDRLRRPDPQQFERAPQPPANVPRQQPGPAPPSQVGSPPSEGIRRPPPPTQQQPAYRPPPPQYNSPPPPGAPASGGYQGQPPGYPGQAGFDPRVGQPAPSNLPVPVEPPPSGVPIHPAQLVENIPRRMTRGVSQIVEVRVARADLSNLADGMQGQGLAQRHELIITQAMSLRLRAPNGGFFIETSSPETQWIENKLGLLNDDYASWRWTITPQRTGRENLQLIVSARTVGGDGLMAETALPDQVFEVRVATNYKSLALRWSGWAAAVVIGGLFAKFGEQILSIGQAFLNT